MDTENTQVSKEKKFQKPQGEKRPNSAPGNRDKPRPEFKKPNFKKEQKETENNVTEKAVEQEGAPANEAGEDSNALPGKPTDNKPESREKKGRIFLSNLVYDTNEKMLRKLCAEFGPIKEVAIPMDASTNKPKGFAFLEFENKNSALKAVTKLNNSKWKGRNIGVSLAVDKRKYLETADEGKRAASAGKTDGQKGPGAQGAAGETPASGIVDGIEIVKSKTKGPRAGGENAPAENGAEDEKKMNRKERRAITNAIQGKGKVGEGDEAEEEAGAKQQAKKGKGKQDNEKGKKMTKEEEDEMDELDRIVMANIQELGGNFDLDEEDDEEEEEAPKKGAKDATKTKKSKIANEIEDEPMDEEDLGESKVGIREIDVKAEAKKLASAGQQKSDYKDLLEEKEKELKKKEVKKNEEEDMSHTCFIRGVSFDVNEKELYKFIKENIGDIVYLKMVKFKANETKHNGNGFIKFKDQNVMQRVIEMTEQFNNGNYVPKPKDPKVELNGIRIQFFQALRKQDAKDIKIQREKELAKKDEPEKKERHKKFKSMEELIAGDKTGKRRLAYTKLGFFDAIDEEKLNDFDKQQRQSHRQEKLVKMGNPNYFVSEKRVLLKNIDKLLTDLQVKKLISEVLSNRLSQTDLKKQKIFSDVKIITSKTEESTGKSSGIAFVEFYKPEYAKTFLEEVAEPSRARKFNQKRWPIIEFAFEDIRVVKKIDKIRQPQKAKTAEKPISGEGEDLESKVDKLREKEKKQKEKSLLDQDRKYVKLKLSEMSEDASKATKEAVLNLVKLAKKNRGLKQRIKKKYPQYFLEETQNAKPVDANKRQDSQIKKPKETNLKKRKPDPLRKEEDKIERQIKQKKKKRENQTDQDRLDELEAEYTRQLVKKNKWANQ